MEFSPTDEELVELIETVGEAATDINLGKLDKGGKETRRFYIDTTVKRYFRIYRDIHHTIPSKSLFSEAVNWYVSENFGDNITLSRIMKSLMRELVYNPYERYRREAYNPA